MGIPLLALFATLLLLLPLPLLVLRFAKPSIARNSFVAALGVSSFLAFIPLFTILFNVIYTSTIDYGFDVSPAAVKGFAIPENASKIDFYSKYGPTSLISQFSIDERGFLDWMKQEGRTVQTISNPETVIMLVQNDDIQQKQIEIQYGYRWDNYGNNDDAGTTIVFDAAKNRVYIRQSDW